MVKNKGKIKTRPSLSCFFFSDWASFLTTHWVALGNGNSFLLLHCGLFARAVISVPMDKPALPWATVSGKTQSPPPWSRLCGLQENTGSAGESLPSCLIPFLLVSPWCSQGCFSHFFPHCGAEFNPYVVFTEAPSAWMRVSVVPWDGAIGAIWSQLCPAQGRPGLTSQGWPCSSPLPMPPHRFLLCPPGVYAKQVFSFLAKFINWFSFALSDLQRVSSLVLDCWCQEIHRAPHVHSAAGPSLWRRVVYVVCTLLFLFPI